jgi:hypothetical protein
VWKNRSNSFDVAAKPQHQTNIRFLPSCRRRKALMRPASKKQAGCLSHKVEFYESFVQQSALVGNA